MMEHPAPKAGWLQKRGQVVKSWTSRYVTIDQSGMTYSVDENRMEVKGTVPLTQLQSVGACPYTMEWFKSGGYYFQLATNETRSNRVYYFFTFDKAECDDWIRAFTVWMEWFKAPSQPIAAPSAPSQEQAIPSAPGPESPYAQFLQFQPLYPSKLDEMPASMKYPALVPTTRALERPPAPPRPLRTLVGQVLKDVANYDSDQTKAYVEAQIAYCNVLLNQHLEMKKSSILCMYLVLSSLDYDNRNTVPTTFVCAPSYECDIVFPYFAYAIALVRQDILSIWNSDGPSLVTLIDTWIKRKRRDYQEMLTKEDRESFVKRNLLMLNHSSVSYATGNAEIDDAIAVLIDRFLEGYDQLPQNRLSASLWKGVEAKISDRDKTQVAALLRAYLIFQKLKLEIDAIKLCALDPYLGNHFITVLNNFQFTVQPTLAVVQRDVQSAMMKIFMMWQWDLPLIPLHLKGDFPATITVVSKVVLRIRAVLESMFPSLSDSLQALKWQLDQSARVNNNGEKPVIPSAPLGYNSEDANELADVVSKMLNKTRQ